MIWEWWGCIGDIDIEDRESGDVGWVCVCGLVGVYLCLGLCCVYCVHVCMCDIESVNGDGG